jgi:hypothetical protein
LRVKLYNFVAQAGNELNARIAATTSLDSAAMKTLAFVTTIFLPLSFVASLFSIPVFDWQASSEDGSSDHSVVSSRFWIYWVVSIPLTAATLVGWRLWWNHQKMHYAMEYPQVLRVVGEKMGHVDRQRDKLGGRSYARGSGQPPEAVQGRPASPVRRDPNGYVLRRLLPVRSRPADQPPLADA